MIKTRKDQEGSIVYLGDYARSEWDEKLGGLIREKYRTSQIWEWVYQKQEFDFAGMTNLPQDLRSQLDKNFGIFPMAFAKKQKSRDGTQKFLYRSVDGQKFEGVMIPEKDRRTLCVSSQVGCALNCTFCATGLMDYKRNLEVSEIIGQVVLAEKFLSEKITNVVFMGMGEPLMNYANVLKAVTILNCQNGINLGARKMTISTAGIADKIAVLAEFPLQVRLSISLHAVTDAKRKKIMPINTRYNLESLFRSIRKYVEKSSRKVTFEYILIQGFNDGEDDAKKLADLVRSLAHTVNLIPYNPVEELSFHPPSPERIRQFAQVLRDQKVFSTIRTQRGADIDAACGQLAIRQAR